MIEKGYFPMTAAYAIHTFTADGRHATDSVVYATMPFASMAYTAAVNHMNFCPEAGIAEVQLFDYAQDIAIAIAYKDEPKPTYCARIVFYSREGWNLQDQAFTSHEDAEEMFDALRGPGNTDLPPNWYAARLELFDGLLHINFRIQDTIYR